MKMNFSGEEGVIFSQVDSGISFLCVNVQPHHFDERLYLKMTTTINNNDGKYNAIDLLSGEPVYIDEKKVVFPRPNAKIVLE